MQRLLLTLIVLRKSSLMQRVVSARQLPFVSRGVVGLVLVLLFGTTAHSGNVAVAIRRHVRPLVIGAPAKCSTIPLRYSTMRPSRALSIGRLLFVRTVALHDGLRRKWQVAARPVNLNSIRYFSVLLTLHVALLMVSRPAGMLAFQFSAVARVPAPRL